MDISTILTLRFRLISHRGASVARKFAQAYPVALLARNPSNFESLVKEINSSGGKAVGISCDASDGSSVKAAFEQLQKDFGDAKLAAAVYNVGGRFIRKPFLELSQDEFESGWEANGRGAFHFSQAVLPLLLDQVNASPEHPPTLIFTSATAAMKGSALCSSFASGKFAMRSIAQVSLKYPLMATVAILFFCSTLGDLNLEMWQS